jgi:hypothetical protein
VGRRSTGGVLVLDSDLFLDVCVVATDVGVLGVRVVVTVGVEGVGDAFSYLVGGFVSNVVETVTETVVLAFLVVVTDVALVWGPRSLAGLMICRCRPVLSYSIYKFWDYNECLNVL